MHKRTVQKFLRTFEDDEVLLPHDNAAGGRGKIKGWKIDLARAEELYGEGGRGFGNADDEAEKDGVEAPFEIADANQKGGATSIKGGATCNPPTPPYKDEPKEPTTISPDGDMSAAGRAVATSPDLKSRIFGPALDWLAGQSSRPKDKLRSMVGRWCRDHGDGRVLEILTQAARAGAIEPIAWIERTLTEQRDGRKRDNLGGLTAGQAAVAGILDRDTG